MKTHDDLGIAIPRILLPREGIDRTRWSVIACDQFTSEPETWHDIARQVGDAPSTLKMILPEAFLGAPGEDERIASAQRTMRRYLDEGVLVPHDGMVYVERTACSRTRKGLLLCLDLNRYDFRVGSQSLIRATEGTIVERLPPRVRVRQGAALELPHILVLIDDPDRTVIEPLAARRDELRRLYDFDLMLGAGHLSGYGAAGAEIEASVVRALSALASPETFRRRYGTSADKGVLLFAVGDGNHSLATAKTIWEARRAEAKPDHPLRHALVEIENVHDDGLVFEPIHRVLFGVAGDFVAGLRAHYDGTMSYTACASAAEMIAAVDRDAPVQTVGLVEGPSLGLLSFPGAKSRLAAGTLERPLDGLLAGGGAGRIDYVHGKDGVLSLGSQPGNAALYLPAMPKSDLFRSVVEGGSLPRKTFSMGHAIEKRFYMECRTIAV
jgi:hypothetical protein